VLDLRGSLTLERALQGLIVTAIVTALLAAGSLVDLLGPARKARWLALVALAAVAAAYSWRRRHAWRPGLAHAAAAAFVVVCALSAAWSAFPGLTFARAVSLALVFVAAAGAAVGAAARTESLRRVVDAVVWAAALVAVGGLLVLAFADDRAVQAASADEGARYQGLGGGPNTAPLLLAVALPLAAHTAVDARSTRRRAVGVAVAALIFGSIVASGSRGALVAVAAGMLAYAALVVSAPRGRLLALALTAALLAAGVLASRLPEPDPDAPARLGTILPRPEIASADGYFDADLVLRLQDDLGRPNGAGSTLETSRSLLGGSGRRQAWGGAVRLGAERPAVGYGFGTENKVFVDRYFAHGSNLPENSYVGLFLQLGVLGVALFAALVGALAYGGRVALRRPLGPRGRIAAACASALLAGLVLALTQSYIYAAGSNATLAVWLCAFLLPAAAARSDALA
jgi:O-antigen ligase/polysaccharide polymerase Wzy-like membrane protein